MYSSKVIARHTSDLYYICIGIKEWGNICGLNCRNARIKEGKLHVSQVPSSCSIRRGTKLLTTKEQYEHTQV